jgi:hypothetical protein
MRQGWVRVTGWTLATGAMVGLSWYGVHSVLHPRSVVPRAAFASDGLPADPPPTGTAAGSASARPSASVSAARTSLTPSPTATTVVPASSSAVPSRTTSPSAPTTGVERTYAVRGGRAVFLLSATSASLVSATPDPGWSAQEWHGPDWIRVVFTARNQGSNGQAQVSVVTCSWQGHAPTVQTYTS